MDAFARRLGLLAVAAGLAGGLAAVLARRRRDPPARPDPTYRCDCGAVYRVRGVDRHRVYWPQDAQDPVLGDACVRCGAALPAGHDSVVT